MIKKNQHTLILPKTNIKKRLDLIIKQHFPNYSRSCIKKWISNKLVILDDIIIKKPKKISGGKLIIIHDNNPNILHPEPQNLPLDILYEDQYILVINKQKNLVVHPGTNNLNGTLLNALLYKYPILVSIPRAGIVHRLDKDTTGLMLIAKTINAQLKLIDMIKRHEIIREYEAIVVGIVPSNGTIDAPIGRHSTKKTQMTVSLQGKNAITHYNVIEYFRNHSRINIRLETGRTHQIRVHMAYINHPLLGDQVYGKHVSVVQKNKHITMNEMFHFNRQALHAIKLIFTHPITNARMVIDAPIPVDINNLINSLKKDHRIIKF
ncbi:23S rRNA pseudouridine(1911/1915/1917) synthase RluD [Candidatus Pantoea edessiphila]|uniref:Pseudouridine synthase n=1 Tax=Candidatus Pantoea edessiphila TaxID=2044610 RepID=A0A2P5SZH8_9GAMM|nr:23S rRNA pseudouridine(1911/1915/1917) synthase RluD [Candidatus Pantoea edessiphila]PPI87741.1 23S rRNA pseudouridine(1911/1915/1917) synthase RluD [Candidatus Pantoea edessiphila]